MTRSLRLVGIGLGDPSHLTVEAVDALRSASFAMVTVKRAGDPLATARRAILDRYAPGLPVIEIVDPERDRSAASTATTGSYEAVVADWHEARALAWESALVRAWNYSDGEGGAATGVLLVWGDPAFYDSSIRVVERVLARGTIDFTWDVLPGISALQLLAARHRLVLHEVGQPLVVTTARRLRETIAAGADNVLVMLTGRLDLDQLRDWKIWWGVNLGAGSERLVAGVVADVLPVIKEARDSARAEEGWVMDVYLLRR